MLEHHPSIDTTRQYIVYVCPVGRLSEQLDRYLLASRETIGRNAAHQYMPHCTLTGFFRDQPDSIPTYTAALEAALLRAGPHRPQLAVSILELALGEEFHGLLLDGPWLKALMADFA